jgi:hypothetical protein
MADLDAKGLTQAKRYKEAGDAADQGQQVVLTANAAHPLEELPSVKNSDAVKEHDQAGQANGPGNLRLRRKCAEREADEQNGANTKRESTDVDLPNQVTDADRKECGEDWLSADDLTGKI